MVQIAVDGNILNYIEVGKGSATPVLILHGWGRSATEWQGMASDLASYSGRKIYILDLPGFGGSSLVSVKDIFEYSEIVQKFCKYLEIEKVIIMGHSLGGRIGIVMATEPFPLVEKLILVDPAGVKTKSIKRLALKSLAKIFGWMPTNLRRKLISGFMDEDYKNNPRLRTLYKAVVAHDLTNLLTKIECSTWIVWGEEDKVLPISLAKIYKRLIPNSLLRIVWGAQHDPHLTHYDQLKRILEEAVE